MERAVSLILFSCVRFVQSRDIRDSGYLKFTTRIVNFSTGTLLELSPVCSYSGGISYAIKLLVFKI